MFEIAVKLGGCLVHVHGGIGAKLVLNSRLKTFSRPFVMKFKLEKSWRYPCVCVSIIALSVDFSQSILKSG